MKIAQVMGVVCLLGVAPGILHAGDTNKIEIKGTVLAIEYLTGGFPPGVLQAEVVMSNSATSQGGAEKQLVLQCGPNQLGACTDHFTLLPCGGGGTLIFQEAGPNPGDLFTIYSCFMPHTYGACIKVSGGLLPFGEHFDTTPFITSPIQFDTACSTPPA